MADDRNEQPAAHRANAAANAPAAVVGIGVCAASFASLRRMLSSIGSDVGAALLVAVRQEGLSVPTVVEAIRGEGVVPVDIAADGEPLVANRVYVAGPDDLVTIEDGRIRARASAEPPAHRGTLDTLLISLAETFHDKAVAVLLGGLGPRAAPGSSRPRNMAGCRSPRPPTGSIRPHKGRPIRRGSPT